MPITIVLLSAAILVYALHRKCDVTFMVKLLGAQFLLEAKGADANASSASHENPNGAKP